MRGRGAGRGGKRGRGRASKLQVNEEPRKRLVIKKPTYLLGKRSVSGKSSVDENDYQCGSPKDRQSNFGKSPYRAEYIRKRVGRPSKSSALATVQESEDFDYGSDCEHLSDNAEDAGSNSGESDALSRSVYEDESIFSEEELSLPSSAGALQDVLSYSRPPTPVPVWLQDRDMPKLHLPESSDDLVIPRENILQVCGIYEVLRCYWKKLFISPFLLEDFCHALLAEDQTSLLSEIHYQLLCLLIRDDEKHQVTFGPMEYKDSMNAVMYLCDIFSWPESLRMYFHSWYRTGRKDVISALKILSFHEYPFVAFTDRLLVLQLLVDMVIASQTIRNELQREHGPIVYDDHCRKCQKVGDLLCCETCPATYHLECADPPLTQVPDHDWQCQICSRHELEGFTDCVSDMEKNGALIRQETLGYDRQGCRYWFLARRIFVENVDSGELMAYYSSEVQLVQLLASLDSTDLEDTLCMTLQELSYDISRQMALTERLTRQRCPSTNSSYLQTDTERRLRSSASCPEGDVKRETVDPSTDDAVKDPTDDTRIQLVGGQTLVLKRAAGTEDVQLKQQPQLFRLGDAIDSAGARLYDNLYRTCTALSLSRVQQASLNKRRAMCHKFSMSDAAEFHWVGDTTGDRECLRATVRRSLLQLADRLPAALMHPSWPLLKTSWRTSTRAAVKPRDFSSSLVLLSSLIRPRVFCPVWAESLAHVELHRMTSQQREARRKTLDRRDRKGGAGGSTSHSQTVSGVLDDEDAVVSAAVVSGVPLVKFSKKVKHQVWKQRGEEYRLTGHGGWVWLSNTRRYRPETPTRRHLIQPTAAAVQGNDPSEASQQVESVSSDDVTASSMTSADGVVDVSEGLRSPSRRLFPRVVSGSAWMDRLLCWRVAMEQKLKNAQIKPADEQQSDLVSKVDTAEDVVKNTAEDAGAVEESVDSGGGGGAVEEPSDTVGGAVEVGGGGDAVEVGGWRPLHVYSCYNPSCRPDSPLNACFSPQCRINAAKNFPESGVTKSGEVGLPQSLLKSTSDVDKHNTEAPLDESPMLLCTEMPVELTRLDPAIKPQSVKFPPVSKFVSSCRWSLLVLPTWELRQLGRRRGQQLVEGFNYTAKNNPVVWVYPCARPVWRTGWLYRTRRVRGVHSAALQLRQLWACIRWEELEASPDQVGAGEFQITTDTGMVRSLVLKHRDEGRFRQRTMYYRRRVTILFDPPVMIEKEYISSARSGLRKRRKVIESSDTPSSDVIQEWVSEEQLQLFEIRYYYEKMERVKVERRLHLQKQQRSQSPSIGNSDVARLSASNSLLSVRANTPLKSRLENVSAKQVILAKTPGKGTKFIVKPSVTTMPNQLLRSVTASVAGSFRAAPAVIAARPAAAAGAPLLARKLVTKDGRVLALRSCVAQPALAPRRAVTSSGVTAPLTTASVSSRMSLKDPTITATSSPRLIVKTNAPRASLLNSTPTSITTSCLSPVTKVSSVKSTTAAAPATNQIQIIRLPDGTMRIKGLKQGQQIVQLPGGQMQLMSGGSAPPKNLQAINKPAQIPVCTVDAATGTPELSKPPLLESAVTTRRPPVLQTSPLQPTQIDQQQLQTLKDVSTLDSSDVPVVSTPVPISPRKPSPGQPKMVTQVINMTGMDIEQLTSWQLKINEGKAKLAMVNGRKVILHNILVNAATTTSQPAGLPSPAAVSLPSPSVDSPSAPAGSPSASSGLPSAPAGLPSEPAGPPTTVAESSDRCSAVKVDPGAAGSVGASPSERLADVLPSPDTGSGDRRPDKTADASGFEPEFPPGRRITATANIVQTLNSGPRVVIQGVPTHGLSAPQLANLQQQVKAELARGPQLTSGLREIDLIIPADESPLKPPTPEVKSEPAETPAGSVVDCPVTAVSPTTTAAVEESPMQSPDFTVTQEYIQQSVSRALNAGNLRPETVAKLRQMSKKPPASGNPVNISAKPQTGNSTAKAPSSGNTATTAKKRQSASSSVRVEKSRALEAERRAGVLLTLQKRKEQLKREILRKRLSMEQELQLAISHDLSSKKTQPASVHRTAVKKRRRSGKSQEAEQLHPSKRLNTAAVGSSKKVHCICKQPFDPSKFYVGCDMCSNWYHGTCVGISQRASKKLNGYVCQQCQEAKEQKQLFCLCRTEYDESQFYIGCDRCEDWFHGRCIGVLPSEGDSMEDYLCPRCQPQSSINRANFTPLSDSARTLLYKLMKLIQSNKNAAPFLEPVDPDKVPSYYSVIKQPMDLRTISLRLESRYYARLCDFTGDWILMLENCKYFNPPGSRLADCCTSLENTFRTQLARLRQKVAL